MSFLSQTLHNSPSLRRTFAFACLSLLPQLLEAKEGYLLSPIDTLPSERKPSIVGPTQTEATLNSLDSLSTHKEVSVRPRSFDRFLWNTAVEAWELSDTTQRSSFRPTAYRPIYVLPFRWSNRMNGQPFTTNPNRPIPEPKDYSSIEAKFQVSLKVKIWKDVLGAGGDLWIAYTQDAYWQIYAQSISRPFRELNYQPELMYVQPMRVSIGDLHWRMASISINHQSNGKEHNLSRSWDRVILNSIFEWRSIMLRLSYFHRLRQELPEDDNPDLHRYIGPLEVEGIYTWGQKRYGLSLRATNNLRLSKNRGYYEASFAFPFYRSLKGLLQISHGYGDSMIDYNHKQTTVGLGFVFLPF